MSRLLCWWQYFINDWADRNPPVQPPYQTSAAPTWKIGDRPGSRQDWPHIDCTMFLVQSKIMRWYNQIEWGSTLYRFGTLPLLASYFLCFSNLWLLHICFRVESQQRVFVVSSGCIDVSRSPGCILMYVCHQDVFVFTCVPPGCMQMHVGGSSAAAGEERKQPAPPLLVNRRSKHTLRTL